MLRARCRRGHACASAAVSYGAADRVMHCRGTEKDRIPRESNRGGILTPHTIAHRDREPGELLEYRRQRALNASITIIIEMRQNYARSCTATILENRAGVTSGSLDAPLVEG